MSEDAEATATNDFSSYAAPPKPTPPAKDAPPLRFSVTIPKEKPGQVRAAAPARPSCVRAALGVGLLALAALAGLLAGLLVPRGGAAGGAQPGGPTIRTYHLAVEEVQWRYAPSGYDNCSGVPAAESMYASLFTVPNATLGLIGDTYWRRRYVDYEPDGSFSVARAGGWWPHAGVQGPGLRAGVGEVLRVRLLNRGRFPASLHVHGVPLDSVARGNLVAGDAPLHTTVLTLVLSFFSGAARLGATVLGAPKEPFSSGGRSSVCEGAGCAALGAGSLLVAPGDVAEFSWAIGEEAGPEGAAGSVGRLYSDLTYNGYADPGLAGVLVVTPQGCDASQPPQDAAAEMLALFSVAMETASPYLPLNVLDFVWRRRVAEALEASAPTAAGAALALARLATTPSSPYLPVPASASPAELLAALLNAALADGGSLNASHPAILHALGAASAGLLPGETLSLPATLLGMSLGAAGATLTEGSLVGAPAFYLLNATAFVAAHSQWALEGAVAPLALDALYAEPAFDAGAFEESNTMHGLNGLLFCNAAALPGAALPMAVLGATTRWYVAVLGTEVDLHSAHWHGNTVLQRESAGGAFRTDSIALLPRQIKTADMVAHAAGRWLFHCHVTDHIEAGMLAVYDAAPRAGASLSEWLPVFPAGSTGADATPLPQPPPALAAELRGGRLREYFIQAETGGWSYLRGPVGATAGGQPDSAASGATPCGALDFAALDDRYNGSFTWPKVRFVRYTDATFTTPWAPPTADEAARWEHLALLGPVLRGEVGDTLRVWFRNAAPVPFSLHPHGVVYPKGSEGAPYADGTGDLRDTGDGMVAPNSTWPYTWFLPEASGPGPDDPSSIPWLYHGHVHEAADENTGLVGVLLVTGRGRARVPGSAAEADLRPADVDRELVVMAKVFDEGAASSELHMHNELNHLLPEPTPGSRAALAPEDFSTFSTLNGLIGCRLHLAAAAGERVRLYGVSLGNEIDLHTLGVSGHALLFRGKRQEGLSLLPGTMYAADTVAAAGGGWLLGSSVIHHAERGMVARFTVAGAVSALSPAPGGAVREYFVAASEVEWDYAPAGKDLCVSDAFKAAEGDLFPPLDAGERYGADGTDLQGFSDTVRKFVAAGNTSIGRRYLKARYLGFQDGAFLAPLANEFNSSTGLLGPTLRAAPGDVLRVVLRNNLAFPVNLAFPTAPLLLLQLRERAVGAAGWGAAVGGSPAELAARPVAPGSEAEASWLVPVDAGPGPADPPTIAWAYGSAVTPDHLYAGLVGGLIVGASPAALTVGAAAHGASREYVLAWFIANENRSPFLAHNMLHYMGASMDETDEDFVESNLKHAVSGRLACNLGNLVARRGERVRFHLLGLGSELDMHTPQVHGNMMGVGARARASHVAALGVHPGGRATAEIVAHTGGKWLLECGVNDHWAAGMRALLAVAEPGEALDHDSHEWNDQGAGRALGQFM